jgi:general secretion pathway protein I
LPRARRERAGRGAGGGFTLIEVLVALAIVAVALAAGCAPPAPDRQRRAPVDGGGGAVVRRQPLAEHCACRGRMPGVGDADFSCEQLGRSYAGRMLVTRPTPNPSFRRVDAQVSECRACRWCALSTVAAAADDAPCPPARPPPASRWWRCWWR